MSSLMLMLSILSLFQYTDSDNMLYMFPNMKDIEEARWYQSNCGLKYGRRPSSHRFCIIIFYPLKGEETSFVEKPFYFARHNH
jgi:hypothetical protein